MKTCYKYTIIITGLVGWLKFNDAFSTISPVNITPTCPSRDAILCLTQLSEPSLQSRSSCVLCKHNQHYLYKICTRRMHGFDARPHLIPGKIKMSCHMWTELLHRRNHPVDPWDVSPPTLEITGTKCVLSPLIFVTGCRFLRWAAWEANSAPGTS